MKNLLIVVLIVLGCSCVKAQDYFAVVKKNNDLTYHYPENTTFTLYDTEGNSSKINKGDAISVSGDYKLEADVYWKDSPDIITSDGGTLEIFVLENRPHKNYTPSTKSNAVYDVSKEWEKPQLEKKTITPSLKNAEKYNAIFVFTNGMVFSYTDGKTRAYQDGEALKIADHYIVKGKNVTLKISFDPTNAEMWYVFER